MSVFKTPKGTELPIMALKGKDYLEVKYRLIWFREERPDWSIETEFHTLNAQVAIAKATIRDKEGRIVSTSHKSETPKGFADFIEKAETGAIGRALALCGYGTQFTDELDEGDRIVDSPVERHAQKPAGAQRSTGPSDAQIKRLYTIATKHKVSQEILKEYAKTHFGVESSRDLNKQQYDQLCQDIEMGNIAPLGEPGWAG